MVVSLHFPLCSEPGAEVPLKQRAITPSDDGPGLVSARWLHHPLVCGLTITVGLKTTPRTATPTRLRLENEAESATRIECIVTGRLLDRPLG